MKIKLFLFGIPTTDMGVFNIYLYKYPVGNTHGEQIYSDTNSTSDILTIQFDEEIEIGEKLILKIMSSGICEYNQQFEFSGGDISHVPIFRKEDNANDTWIMKDWDLDSWKNWHPRMMYDDGIDKQNIYISDGKINLEPIWKAYYRQSQIDYFERFHRLWIGFNTFASYFSDNKRELYKLLDLANSDIPKKFHKLIHSPKYDSIAKTLEDIHKATGVNTTGDILQLELTSPSNIINFMEECKTRRNLFEKIDDKLFDSMIFLQSKEGEKIFSKLYRTYGEYMASEQGSVEVYHASNIFNIPKAPSSIEQIGSLVFHNHLKENKKEGLFGLADYFGEDYQTDPYQGSSTKEHVPYETKDPLFYKYILLLSNFRNAYFHGDFILNEENNELAKYAYLSLLEIYPKNI